MNGKISFGVDFLNVLGMMSLRSKNGIDPVLKATMMVFLVDWGLTAQEVDEASQAFWQHVSKETLDNFGIVCQRIVNAIANREEDKKRLMRQLSAIAHLDFDLTDEEIDYYKFWGETLDYKPSETKVLFDSGLQLAQALRFFGQQFKKYVD